MLGAPRVSRGEYDQCSLSFPGQRPLPRMHTSDAGQQLPRWPRNRSFGSAPCPSPAPQICSRRPVMCAQKEKAQGHGPHCPLPSVAEHTALVWGWGREDRQRPPSCLTGCGRKRERTGHASKLKHSERGKPQDRAPRDTRGVSVTTKYREELSRKLHCCTSGWCQYLRSANIIKL